MVPAGNKVEMNVEEAMFHAVDQHCAQRSTGADA